MIVLTEKQFLHYDSGRPSENDRFFYLEEGRTHLQWLNTASSMQQIFIAGTFSTTFPLYRNEQVTYELFLTGHLLESCFFVIRVN